MPFQLSAAGFYFDPPPNSGTAEDSDRVACYLCSIVLTHWKPNQDPMIRHRNEYNECPVVHTAPVHRSSNKEHPVAPRIRPISWEIKSKRRQTFGKWWPYRKDAGYLAIPAKV